MNQVPASTPSALAARASRVIEAVTPDGCGPRTDWYIAHLVNDTAERMYAAGLLDAPTSVCDGWVRDLRTGVQGGHSHGGDEHRRNLVAFAEALGVPLAYLVSGDQDVATALELVIHMKGTVRLIPFAQQVTRLPAAERRKIIRAIDAAEQDDLTAGHLPLLSPLAVSAMSVVHHEVIDAMRAGATANSGPRAGIAMA